VTVQESLKNRAFLAVFSVIFVSTRPIRSTIIGGSIVDTFVGSENVAMARTTEKLTALEVPRLTKKPGLYADGAGLYLQVTRGGASWLLRYSIAGRARYMGLGPLRLFGLADARAKAAEAQRLLHDGNDPIEARRDARAKARLDAAKSITFKKATEGYIASHSAGWTGAKVKSQWEATLRDYAYPIIGALPVQSVDTSLVHNVLQPIWTSKPETAGRVRQRIEAILDWAKVRGYRNGENPARWKGHLDKLLPARGKVRKVEHHAALPYSEIGAFMVALRWHEAVAARAFEFAILTAARTNEALGARWDEIDLTEKVWTIPAERMKADKEHRVPLNAPAIAIIEEMAKLRSADSAEDAYVFPGQRRGKPLSNMAFLMLLRRMKRSDLTAHGFRSTFRDWVAERTDFPNEVAEMALAHVVADKVEAAYRRGDLFEKRRQLMAAWAEWCSKQAPANSAAVTAIAGSAAAS
jgi:integrase